MSERVTAGIPALTPHRRRAGDRVRRTREHNRVALKQKLRNEHLAVRPDGPIDRSNALAQLGHPLSGPDLVAKLKRLNPNLIFERSVNFPSKMGIYVMAEQRDPITGQRERIKQFICGFEAGFMPEFSVLHTKPEEVPDPDIMGHWRKIDAFAEETRGWRTVLARLLKVGMIREPQINLEFEFSRDSQIWQELTI